MHGYIITVFEYVIPLRDYLKVFRRLPFEKRIVSNHFHVKAVKCLFSNQCADFSHTYEAKGLSAQFRLRDSHFCIAVVFYVMI